jgi:hypothetical protein
VPHGFSPGTVPNMSACCGGEVYRVGCALFHRFGLQT